MRRFPSHRCLPAGCGCSSEPAYELAVRLASRLVIQTGLPRLPTLASRGGRVQGVFLTTERLQIIREIAAQSLRFVHPDPVERCTATAVKREANSPASCSTVTSVMCASRETAVTTVPSKSLTGAA